MKEKISWFNEIPAKVFLVFSVIGLFYFYLPDFVLFRMESKYEKIAYIIFIFSVVISILNGLQMLWKAINKSIISIKDKKYFRELLITIDPHERAVLCEFYAQNRNSLSLNYNDSVVQGLVAKYVLVNTGNLGGGILVNGNTMTYRINSNLTAIIDPEKDLGLSSYIKAKKQNERFY